MSTQISEKTAETLFNRYMLQWLGLGKAQLFAPTTPQEFESGYDAKIVGATSMREIYLQFKAPTFSERDRRFSFELTPHQHARLRRYPAGSAFYVAPYFTSLQQLNQVQSSVTTTEDYLRYYVCVDVQAVTLEARAVTFGVPATQRHSVEPGYKEARHGKSPRDFKAIEPSFWERGNSLVARLKQGKVGRTVQLVSEADPRAAAKLEAETSVFIEVPSASECRGLGSFIRILPADETAA